MEEIETAIEIAQDFTDESFSIACSLILEAFSRSPHITDILNPEQIIEIKQIIFQSFTKDSDEQLTSMSIDLLINLIMKLPETAQQFFSENLYTRFIDIINKRKNSEDNHKLLNIIEILSNYCPDEVSSKIGTHPVLSIYESIKDATDHTTYVNILTNILNVRPPNVKQGNIESTIKILCGVKTNLLEQALNIALLHLKYGKAFINGIPKEVIKKYLGIFPKCAGETLKLFFYALHLMCKSERNRKYVIDHFSDFSAIWKYPDASTYICKFATHNVSFITINQDPILFRKELHFDQHTIKLAKMLQKHLFQYFNHAIQPNDSIHVLFSFVMVVNPVNPPMEFLNSIASIPLNPMAAFHLLYGIIFIPDKTEIFDTNIIPSLTKCNPIENVRNQYYFIARQINARFVNYRKHLMPLQLQFDTLTSQLISAKETNIARLITSGFFSSARNILEKRKLKSNDVKIIANLCSQVISEVVIRQPNNVMRPKPTEKFCAGINEVKIDILGSLSSLNITTFDTGGSFDHFIKTDEREIALRKLRNSNPLFTFDSSFTPIEGAFIGRALKLKDFSTAKLSLHGRVIHQTDSILLEIYECSEDPMKDEIIEVVISNSFVPSKKEELVAAMMYNSLQLPKTRNPVKMVLRADQYHIDSFECLRIIKKKYPSVKIHLKKIQQKYSKHLSSFYSVFRLDPHFQATLCYPELFTPEMRRLAFKLAVFPVRNAFEVFKNEVDGDRTPLLACRSHVQPKIRRESIFEDGVKLLELFGDAPLQFDVAFVNEEGIGKGPTHEFYTLFAREFTRPERGLFLSTGQGEFATREGGLIFAPAPPKKIAKSFGLLLARMVSEGVSLNIPLSTLFFKIMRKDKVTLEEIDPELARVLSDPQNLIGLDFTLPGTEIKLDEGEVNTLEDGRKLAALIREYYEQKYPLIAYEEFMLGMHQLLRPGAWRSMGADELQTLFCGELPRLSMEELREGITKARGFYKGSPTVDWFYEAVSELSPKEAADFLRFTTGCPRLPVGGLKSLVPPITLACKEGLDMLPTCSTCSNYIKLSEYSCKEALVRNLKHAIMEENSEFSKT